MNVCSIEWVACLIVLSAAFFFVRTPLLRQAVLGWANFAFVMTLIPDFAAFMALAGFILFGYAAAVVLKRHPSKPLLVAYLALVLGAFVILKQYAFIKLILPAFLFQNAVATVGWSYILFRQIQVAVDAAQGQIEQLSFWNYLNFQWNVFGFLAGPIQRYEEFCTYWNKLTPIATDAESILRAYLRVFTGALKITLFAGLFIGQFKSGSLTLLNPVIMTSESFGRRVAQFLGVFYSYPLYIYLNFSGYCDMVIGGALLFGIRMPENFDRPYLSRNMIEFWTRWHRTLGFWIRDYIFTPMYKAIAGRWPAKASSLAFLCYFGAFFLAGVWHGSTWNFVVYGFLNGLGLAVTKLWETQLIRLRGRARLKDYLQNKTIRVVATIFTLHFAALTMFFFSSDLTKTLHILKNVFLKPS